MGFATERENLVFTAKLAQQAERYDEMVEAMKQVAKNVELTAEERDLLYVGYKNVAGARRSSWRVLSSTEQMEEARRNNMMKELKEYRQKVESEISTICGDVITLLDEHLIPSASDGESTAFYYKMKGDYYRYLAELKSVHERDAAADESKKAYETATAVARAELPPTHVIRLNVAVNFSVLCYEVLNTPEAGCCVAKIAFDEGIAEIDSLKDQAYKDSLMPLTIMSENYTRWTSQSIMYLH